MSERRHDRVAGRHGHAHVVVHSAGKREALQNGVWPFATPAAHDALVELAAVDDRKLGSSAAAERDGFALEVDGLGVAARCDEDLAPGVAASMAD
jgi:hypothetical protein